MTTQTFLDNFGHLADAPNGIAKLRQFVLQLAVTGKLVPQDPKDEPSSQILKRIGRNHRSNDNKTKDENGPSLPNGWQRTTLRSIIELQYGKGLTKKERVEAGGIPVYGSNGVVGFHDRALISSPAIVVGRKGSIGAVNIANTPFWPIDTTYFIIPEDKLNIIYLSFLLETLELKSLDKATAIPGLNREDAYNQLVLLPPAPEQNRIVAKVDELMKLCDELDEQKRRKTETRAAVSKAALHDLTTVTEPKQMAKAWKRIADHFSIIYDTPETVKDLRQAILQLAVTGKLVPQDPKDESAEKLLERILEDKESIVRQGRTRKQKSLPPILPKDAPHDLPKGWVRVRLGNILSVSSGSALTSANMDKSGKIPVYGGNGVTGQHTEHNVLENTLVIGRVGFYCGSIHKTHSKAWVTDNALICAFSKEHLDTDFMYWLLKSSDLARNDASTAQPVISGSKIYPIVLAIPPLQEQHRIVSRIVVLSSLCDKLESDVMVALSSADQLFDAVVHSMTKQ